MKSSAKTPQPHDHAEEVRKLMRKNAELKGRSQKLNDQLDATRKECEEFLHPENNLPKLT